jgi:hypothetical protein
MPRYDIKAIETEYNGFRFRSRLEARWAVWMDALGIQYRYEPEGFDLDGEWYLPDFFLPFQPRKSWTNGHPPEWGCWLEIKPTPLTDTEERLLCKLAAHTGHTAHAFAGDPWPGDFMWLHARKHTDGHGYLAFLLPDDCWLCGGTGFDAPLKPEVYYRTWRGRRFPYMLPALCPLCSAKRKCPPGETIVDSHSFFSFLCNITPPNGNGTRAEQIKAAFRAARQARFEHGQTPRPPQQPITSGTACDPVIQILATLTDRKIKITVDGENLRFEGPRGAMTEDLRSALTQHKPAILAILRSSHPTQGLLPPWLRPSLPNPEGGQVGDTTHNE